jgi:CTP synthase (UTP-ammonia lyase)
MIMEYARNKMGLKHAGHEERDPDAEQIIIGKLACSLVGQSSEVMVNKHSRAYSIYQAEHTVEPFRCNYGLHPDYRRQLHEAGLEVVGTDSVGNARIVELPEHSFFIGTLFVPQLGSSAVSTHCIVDSFLVAVRDKRAICR